MAGKQDNALSGVLATHVSKTVCQHGHVLKCYRCFFLTFLDCGLRARVDIRLTRDSRAALYFPPDVAEVDQGDAWRAL